MNMFTHLLRRVAGAALAAAILAGCADLKDDIPAPTNPAISVHPEGWPSPASAEFHGSYIAAHGYDMRPCQQCHGSDYSGGVAEVSCKTCHTGTAGPENCATCHGGPGSPSPPTDLSGNTSTSAPGVGAHAKHVLGGSLSGFVWCSECHTVPEGVYVAGHVDSDRPAEVPMNGSLARNPTDGVAPVPVHDAGALTCANVYCHGNWKSNKADAPPDRQFAYMDTAITGLNAIPVWTGGSSQAACGTCHGLPPTGHIPEDLTFCAGCHSGVVDGSGNISNKALHINGKINVFGTERAF
jgi:predicted CxxxxCH...CXXCH cytochrome family protein